MSSRILLVSIFIFGVISIFIFILLTFKKINDKNYINKLNNLNIKSKLKEISSINKLRYYIINNFSLEFRGYRLPLHIIVVLSIFLSISMFLISKKVLNIFSSSLIISIFSFFIPFQILKFIEKRRKEMILKNFPTYLAALKNYTKTQNNIVLALKKVKINNEINPYITKFNNQVENGVKVYDAFEELKFSIGINKISELITLFEYCYMNGGNFNDLIDKYSRILTKINMQKEAEQEKNLSTKLVLMILVIINIYVLFGFIFANPIYSQIMIESFIGRLIININILSYAVIFILFKKMEEMREK